jgi:hypothetical protein
MSITITPNQVNVSSSPATFSVDLGIRDDGTGFNWGVLSFTSPSGKQQVYANPNTIPISGTIKNGVFRATVTMPQAAEAGIWQISSITLMDATGNSASWPYAVLTGQGFQTGVTVVDQQSDVAPPALMSITITPNQVNVSSSPATFSVDLGIRDDGTGFNWGVLSFTSPSGKQQVYANPYTIPISGTTKNGLFRATVTIPQAAEAGIWQISSITLIDATGNSASWSYAVLTGQGFQTGVTVSVGTATISIGPPNLSFQWQTGSSLPHDQTAIVLGSVATGFTAAASGGSWLTVSPTSGTTPANLVVSVNPAGLSPGTYNGMITITAPGASNSPQSVAVTLTVAGSGGPAARITFAGIFRQGFFWLLDQDGNQQFNSPPDRSFAFGGIPGDIPITGDWSGSGTTNVGVYRSSNGLFILDYDGDGQLTAADKVYNLGVGIQAGDVPVVGDWNGDGRTKVGLFRQGFFWILDTNGNGTFDQSVDTAFAFGGVAGDVPIVGDWNGTGTSKVGVFRAGFLWILDANNNHTVDAGDQVFPFGGVPGDVPIVGDWNGDGRTKVGVFRMGFFWVLDTNGNQIFDGGTDQAFAFGGITGDKPVVGKW